ncbi:MAG: hypothetical protein QM765_22535 [Myxococcales bacterium]
MRRLVLVFAAALAALPGCELLVTTEDLFDDAGDLADAARPSADVGIPDSGGADAQAEPSPDAATPVNDAGSPDVGAPIVDAGPTALDSDASVPPDASGPGLDASGPGLDASGPGFDASGAGFDASGPGLDAALPTINAKNLSIVCPHSSIGGFESNGLEMTCEVHAADNAGGFVPGSVSFKTEAGVVVPTSVSLTPNATYGGIGQFVYRALCPAPRDVTPLGSPAGDPGAFCVFSNQCGANNESRTCNPRDGLATLVAYTTGSESFQDTNHNGTWDEGEPFVDLPEPFVDADDSGGYESGEEFVDITPGNGHWDDKNRDWDAQATIWTSLTIRWTGAPQSLTLLPGNAQVTNHCESLQYSGVLTDINGNPPTAADPALDKVSATCTNNCKVSSVQAYSDENGQVSVTVTDAHSCPSTCTAPCTESGYSVGLSIHRTLANGSTTVSNDSLDSIMEPDPGPRTGSFK